MTTQQRTQCIYTTTSTGKIVRRFIYFCLPLCRIKVGGECVWKSSKRLRSLTHRFWPITIHSYHYNLSMDRIVQCKESSFIHSHLPGNASSTLVRRLQMLSQTVGVACRLRNVTHVTPLFDVLLLLLLLLMLFMMMMFASLLFRRYGAPFAFTLGR